jgi:hypothetical protein
MFETRKPRQPLTIRNVLNARWFWILMLISAALGIILAVFVPNTCHF